MFDWVLNTPLIHPYVKIVFRLWTKDYSGIKIPVITF